MGVWCAARGDLDLRHHEALRTGLGADKNAGEAHCTRKRSRWAAHFAGPNHIQNRSHTGRFLICLGPRFNQELQSGIT